MAGKKFPDLTGDGKVTKKDILKGRGVKGFEEGGKVTSDADSKKKKKSPFKRILPKLYPIGKGEKISDADADMFREKLPFYPIKKGKNISSADLEKLLMKPTNYKDGGEVRGMGRAYMGAFRKAKIR